MVSIAKYSIAISLKQLKKAMPESEFGNQARARLHSTDSVSTAKKDVSSV